MRRQLPAIDQRGGDPAGDAGADDEEAGGAEAVVEISHADPESAAEAEPLGRAFSAIMLDVDLDVVTPAPDETSDQVVLLRGVAWSTYSVLLEERGERSVPRLHYLEGDLQVMSPSEFHEADARMT